MLLEQATVFAKVDSKASVFVVSAHQIISEILDYPGIFGFSNPGQTELLTKSDPADSDDSVASEDSTDLENLKNSSGDESESEESTKSSTSKGLDLDKPNDFHEIPDI